MSAIAPIVSVAPNHDSEVGLHALAVAAVAMARSTDCAVLLSHVERLEAEPDAISFLDASSSAIGSGMLWVQPEGQTAFAGAGIAFQASCSRMGRFESTATTIRSLQDRVVRCDQLAFPILGGFAFDELEGEAEGWSDFPGALLVVPQVMLQSVGNATHIRVTIRVDPWTLADSAVNRIRELVGRAHMWSRESSFVASPPRNVVSHAIPSRPSWEASIATAIAMIRQGQLDKVVLAREERLLARSAFSAPGTLVRLRNANPSATLFALQSRASWFIGATPERLVRLAGGHVDVTCLAGSIDIGQTPDEQARFARLLLDSSKDRVEHEIVVRSTMDALTELCHDVCRLPGTPHVVATGSIQHLSTPVSAWLPHGGQIFDLVQRLHPTPAVGGYPRKPALSLIRELEQIERGWYAGPVGWTNLDGSGEFAVAIRSALLTGNSASVYAGSGIVADSVPDLEYEETSLKLRPMLAALGIP